MGDGYGRGLPRWMHGGNMTPRRAGGQTVSIRAYLVRMDRAYANGSMTPEPVPVNQRWCRAEDVAALEAENVALKAEVAKLRQALELPRRIIAQDIAELGTCCCEQVGAPCHLCQCMAWMEKYGEGDSNEG